MAATFSCIVLDQKSQDFLKQKTAEMLPPGFVAEKDKCCHHVTISLSSWDAEMNPSLSLGQNVTLEAYAFGHSDKAAAVKVRCLEAKDLKTKSSFAHITVGLAPGGKPMESANIQEFKEISAITLKGVVDGQLPKDKPPVDPAQQAAQDAAKWLEIKRKIAGGVMSLSKTDVSPDIKTQVKDAVSKAESQDDVRAALALLPAGFADRFLAMLPSQPISKRQARQFRIRV